MRALGQINESVILRLEECIEKLEKKVKAHCEYYPLSYKDKIEKEIAELKQKMGHVESRYISYPKHNDDMTELREEIADLKSVLMKTLRVIERGWKGEQNIWTDMEEIKKKLEKKVKTHCEYYPLSYKDKIEKEIAELKDTIGLLMANSIGKLNHKGYMDYRKKLSGGEKK